MNILFTRSSKNPIGGVQSAIRDLRRALHRKGHSTILFQSDPVAAVGEPDHFVATSRLDDLPVVPDIIHAHHQFDAMLAVMALPGVPAVYSCHGATARQRQPRHPRIVCSTAMTPTLRLRMATESGIPEDDIEIIYNAIDLDRFATVREPTGRPRRALVYQRGFDPGSRLGEEVRKAADATGLDLEFRGLGEALTPITHPEFALPAYDIVFSSGISAIEALACGCAVIVLQGRSACGEMVTPANFQRLQQANFTLPVNSPPPQADRIVGEIAKFAPSMVSATTQMIRATADIDKQADRFVAIYEKAIRTYGANSRQAVAERQAAAHFLRELTAPIRFLDGNYSDRGRPEATKRGLQRQLADVADKLSGEVL